MLMFVFTQRCTW